MLITEEGGYISTSDDESPDTQPVLHTDDIEQCECEPKFPNTEQYSIVCTPRVLRLMPSPSLEQRCNLFQTWAKLDKGKVCKVIIDDESCHNLANKDMCHKLGLKYLPHLCPYHVQWLSDKEEVKVNHIVCVTFSIGKYTNTVDCAVVPMMVCYLLLGRPWKYDHSTIHDGRINHYTFQ